MPVGRLLDPVLIRPLNLCSWFISASEEFSYFLACSAVHIKKFFKKDFIHNFQEFFFLCRRMFCFVLFLIITCLPCCQNGSSIHSSTYSRLLSIPNTSLKLLLLKTSAISMWPHSMDLSVSLSYSTSQPHSAHFIKSSFLKYSKSSFKQY